MNDDSMRLSLSSHTATNRVSEPRKTYQGTITVSIAFVTDFHTHNITLLVQYFINIKGF